MKKMLLLLLLLVNYVWSIPRPMESIENYNVLLLHGAYGEIKGWKNRTQENRIAEAYYASEPLDSGAALGRYSEGPDSSPRLLHWLSTKIFEEPAMSEDTAHPKYSYIYQWRSFSNPANSSKNNAIELGDRSWFIPYWSKNKDTIYRHRRALVEEAQEVKAFEVVDDEGKRHFGQSALEIIRKNPDLYRQIASRYILIGHSMGGVVSREYVQNSDYYHGNVDKIITLDSPHEGTGALNMQIKNEARGDLIYDQMASTLATGVTTMGLTAVPLLLSSTATNLARRWPQDCSRLFCLLAR